MGGWSGAARGVAGGARVRRRFRGHAVLRVELTSARISRTFSRRSRRCSGWCAAVACGSRVDAAPQRTPARRTLPARHAAARVVAVHAARDLRAAVGLRAVQGAARQGDHRIRLAGPRWSRSSACRRWCASPSPYAAKFTFNLLSASGTAALFATLLSAVVLRVPPDELIAIIGRHGARPRAADPHHRLRARARVRDELLGQHRDARSRVRRDGRAVPVLQRVAGLAGRVPDRQRHLGQRAVRQSAGGHGEHAGLSPELMAASNSSGGVMGKMISLQSIAVAAAATGMAHRTKRSCSASRSSTACCWLR